MLTEQREAFSEQSQHCELHPSKAAESLSLTHTGKVKGSSSVRNCKRILKKKKRSATQGGDGLLLWQMIMAYLGLAGQHVRLSGRQGPCLRAFSGGDRGGEEQWPNSPSPEIRPEILQLRTSFSNLWTTATLQWHTVCFVCVSEILLLLLLLSLCDLLQGVINCSFASNYKNNLTMLMVIFRQT